MIYLMVMKQKSHQNTIIPATQKSRPHIEDLKPPSAIRKATTTSTPLKISVQRRPATPHSDYMTLRTKALSRI